jgi:hypothetical protein
MNTLLSNTEELIDDGSGQNTLDQYLLPEELQLMAILNKDEFDIYLEASSSSEKLEAYLNNPALPQHVKSLVKSVHSTMNH